MARSVPWWAGEAARIRQILDERDRQQAESGEVPLYARPHEVIGPTSHGKCEACGRYPEDGIHTALSALVTPDKDPAKIFPHRR